MNLREIKIVVWCEACAPIPLKSSPGVVTANHSVYDSYRPRIVNKTFRITCNANYVNNVI